MLHSCWSNSFVMIVLKTKNILLKKIFEEKKFIWKICIKRNGISFPLLLSAWWPSNPPPRKARRPGPSSPFSLRIRAVVSFVSFPAPSPSFCRAIRGTLAPRPRSPEQFVAAGHGAGLLGLPPATQRAWLESRCPSPSPGVFGVENRAPQRPIGFLRRPCSPRPWSPPPPSSPPAARHPLPLSLNFFF